jgi:hypothetical protein
MGFSHAYNPTGGMDGVAVFFESGITGSRPGDACPREEMTDDSGGGKSWVLCVAACGCSSSVSQTFSEMHLELQETHDPFSSLSRYADSLWAGFLLSRVVLLESSASGSGLMDNLARG